MDAAVAISTEWGSRDDGGDGLMRMENIGATIRKLGPWATNTTLVWPESIIGLYQPASYPILKLEVLNDAKRRGQTQVIGLDLRTAEGRYESLAVAFYPDGSSMTARSRQPVPVALWRPWAGQGDFVADWFASNILTLRSGVDAAVVMCYEEMMPALFLLNELRDSFDVYVVMSNTWAAESPLPSAISTQHSHGMARLFGRPIIKAENRDLPPGHGPARISTSPLAMPLPLPTPAIVGQHPGDAADEAPSGPWRDIVRDGPFGQHRLPSN